MGQPGYDVAVAIGNRFRRCRGQSVSLEMIGEPIQVNPEKYHTGEVPVTVAELLCEIDHFLAASRIDPIISDGQPFVSNRSPKKPLIGDRGYRLSARTKDPALCVGCSKQAVIRVAGPQLRQQY